LGKSSFAFPRHLNQPSKWLIPTTGGDRINNTLTILPALANSYASNNPPEIRLCQVYLPHQAKPPNPEFDQVINLVKSKLNLPINPLLICSSSASEAIINLTMADDYNLVIIGASNEGLLQNIVKGNISNAIARGANSTVIIFRGSL
jgi:chloride channel protein, CIC family